MKVFRDIRAIQEFCAGLRRKGKSIGFVPTMGALHEGHLSLIRAAKKENEIVCVSIFVNPTQFGPSEDFNKYPRPVSRDRALCAGEGVDILFMPSPAQMYGKGARTFVEVGGLGGVLCGASRKGHFRGVATVVAKLFNIVQPDRAYFGRKDFQQTVIVRRMARELNFPVRVVVMPTVREAGGLALSSRNRYLSAQERLRALSLSRSLRLAKQRAAAGVKDSARIIREMKASIGRDARIEYIAIVHPDTLEPVTRINGTAAVVLAARVGSTRLIDNIIISPR